MTAVRLSPLQRQVLEQLAHIRVAPEDAWMTTKRLRQLTGCKPNTLERLLARDLTSYEWGNSPDNTGTDAWRITDKGREALG